MPQVNDQDRRRAATSPAMARNLEPEIMAGHLDWHWLIVLLAEHRESAEFKARSGAI